MASAFERVEGAFVEATKAAAIAAGRLVGNGDKNAIDQAAVDAMRAVLDRAEFDATVVIGEGEKDEAPMLYVGESLGRGGAAALDVAVDPIDGTTIASKGGRGAISVVAAGERGSLLRTRMSYMDKIVAPAAAAGTISLERTPAENIRAVARALGRDPARITIAYLDRPRNAHIVEGIEQTGARAFPFTDGDIVVALRAVLQGQNCIDVLMGIGGAPEGVVTACAVKALGGEMQGRLWVRDERDATIARDEGLDLSRIYRLTDLCSSERTLLAATGVTDGDLLRGVRYERNIPATDSLLISTFGGACRVTTASAATQYALSAHESDERLAAYGNR
ncbi:MAG: class II fructose-bisphosphatase [Vulcanimicrobiaceae bacterium]